MIEEIKQIAASIHQEVVFMRRHFHAHPELSFQEYNTQTYILEKLRAADIQVTPIANTGVLALIHGEKNSNQKVVALRADMDALPIKEENSHLFVSQNEGVMHACGHDVHTASLLGTAIILQKLKSQFSGTVKLLFQPGEEKLPGGASVMIKEGALQNPAPKCIFGQHVYPDLNVGKLGFKAGQYMAACDEIYIEIQGKGGHAALPHKSIDPILVASHVVVALQSVISRNRKPDMPSVLSIGKFIGKGATNIIPDNVILEGTFRSFDEEWRMQAHQIIKQIAEKTASSFGAKAVVNIEKGYPFVYNDPELTQQAKMAAIEYVGADNVVDLELRMTGEDFAYYSQHIPASFYRLGTRNDSTGITNALHTSRFDIDEESLKLSTGFMAYLAIKELER